MNGCTLRGYERDAQRSVIQNFNLAMLATTMATYLGSGIATRAMLPAMALVAPSLLLPALVGMKFYVGINPPRTSLHCGVNAVRA